MHPKIALFLQERDRAYARQDTGVIRSITADLRRLGVADTATLANPTGKRRRAVRTVIEPDMSALEEETRNKGGRPKLPRCEHGSVFDRCPECNEEMGLAT